ncbi:hypothetical protein GCM10025874_12570 [Arenivirga flava]|uniref:Uncharacterized protein n=1 Tax=Arenivirga flava TaxID=1930060 RepID=A0AA37X8Y9_9MICO|nr:DUF6541 family protein [Arenivirga flava]GMA28004.1 hypothetical protein GCM10025874_12570 [Arenivirga flava]
MLTALLIAAAVLLLPGLALGWVLRLGAVRMAALAGPFAVLLLGGAGVVLAWAGVAFAAPQVLLVLAAPVLLAIAVSTRRGLPRLPLRRGWPVVAAGIVAAVAIAWFGLSATAPWGAANQSYDGVFHANVVSSILATGDASSFDLYSIARIGGDGVEFYPGGWHALVATVAMLSGASVPVAEAAVWVGVGALVWVPGVVALADALFGRGPQPRVLLSATALAAAAFPLFPGLLLAWGTIFPTGLAMALLPAGLALLVRAVERGGLREVLLPGALWLGAAGLAHPRSLLSLVAVAAPLAIVVLARLIRFGWQRRRRLTIAAIAASAALLIGGLGAVYLYLVRSYGLAERSLADRLNGGPATATDDLPTALLQSLTMSPALPTGQPAPHAWLLALLCAAALALLLLRGPHRWVAASVLLVIGLYTAAAGSNDDWAKVLTGAWYKDRYRLITLLPMLLAPVLGFAAARIAHGLRDRPKAKRMSAAAAGAVALAIAAVTAGPVAVRDAAAASYAVPASGGLIDADDAAVMAEMPGIVPAGSA